MTVGDQKGRYFCGDYTYLDNAPQVFFPAAGYRNYRDGDANLRGSYGSYWSSRPYGTGLACNLRFYSGDVYSNIIYRASGCSVRCVQE